MPELIFTGHGPFFVKNFRPHFISILFLLICGQSILHAQIIITSPVNNQIQQRDSAGFANIAITAYSYFPYSRIEAHLIPVENNIHQGKDWLFEEEQVSQGFLSVLLPVETGWYRLKLLGYWDDDRVDSAIVDRVGIGEVFLVAGNSNAMGLPDLGSKSSSDQVISFNATNKFLNAENITVAPDEPMQVPEFSPISAKNNIFPSGEVSWYWAELGDMINQKFNTPVLFLNAAWAAANSENYRDAASGKDAFNMYVGKTWPNRQPYSNIVNTIRYFNSWLGVRAVLWSHGENDAQLKVSQDDYFNNIKTLIENSRKDSGYNLPWIISRNTTSSTLDEPYLPIVNAQDSLSALKDFNTFAGPDLDTIQIPRPAHGHFENIAGGIQGLTLAATAWNRTLTDSLFQTIIPFQPKYVIHTGIVPSGVFPGASFAIPYNVTGQHSDTIMLQAELLDESGKFVDTIGVGQENPLSVNLPISLENGKYRIRLAGLNPILTGSVSESFDINTANRKIEYTHTMSARLTDQQIYISWLMAADPQLARIVLQKTTDGGNYTDLESFDAADNDIHSRIYGYQDLNTHEISIFYRLQLEYKNGTTVYSTIVTVFQNGGPPDFVAFPNPVTMQQFYLRSDKPETNFKCALFDIRGREHSLFLTDREVLGLIVVRPLYHLPSGNYILRITTDSGISTQTVLFN